MKSHQLINQTSGDVELFSPPELVDAARWVMCGIELDPASCAAANETIRAARYFTREDDGLRQEWRARTAWMNHPFGQAEKACAPGCRKKICSSRGYCCTRDNPGNAGWVNKLDTSVRRRHVGQACSLCFASTSEAWFQPLLAWPQCFIEGRTNYTLTDGRTGFGAPKGSVVTCLGREVRRFRDAFRRFGVVKIAI